MSPSVTRDFPSGRLHLAQLVVTQVLPRRDQCRDGHRPMRIEDGFLNGVVRHRSVVDHERNERARMATAPRWLYATRQGEQANEVEFVHDLVPSRGQLRSPATGYARECHFALRKDAIGPTAPRRLSCELDVAAGIVSGLARQKGPRPEQKVTAFLERRTAACDRQREQSGSEAVKDQLQ